MGSKWPYGCCFVGCYFQNLSKTAHRILLLVPTSFFSMPFVWVQIVHPYSSTYTATACKKFYFILSEGSDFCMINDFSIAVQTFPTSILTLFSVDEILLSKYVNCFHNFRGLPLKEEMALSTDFKERVFRKSTQLLSCHQEMRNVFTVEGLNNIILSGNKTVLCN